MPDGLTEACAIPEAHLRTVCKYRKGLETCKYIVFKNDCFYCAKNIPEYKKEIDGVTKEMLAKSDNCLGL